jgi:hypothetical protein
MMLNADQAKMWFESVKGKRIALSDWGKICHYVIPKRLDGYMLKCDGFGEEGKLPGEFAYTVRNGFEVDSEGTCWIILCTDTRLGKLYYDYK